MSADEFKTVVVDTLEPIKNDYGFTAYNVDRYTVKLIFPNEEIVLNYDCNGVIEGRSFTCSSNKEECEEEVDIGMIIAKAIREFLNK